MLIPLAHKLALIVAIPETAVEHRGQAGIPLVLFLLGKRAVEHGLNGLLVAADDGVDVFGTTGTTFDFEYTHARLHHAIDEAHSLQVLRTHNVLIIDIELIARLIVGSGIRAAAHLYTLATIGRAVGCVQTKVALAADGHAERAVAEHLYAYLMAAGAADVLLLNLAENLGHLVHIQLTRQHHHIGKLSIELQRLDIRNVKLGTEMNLLPHLVTIGHHSHIAGNDGRDAGLLGGIDNLVHQGDVLAIDDGVDGKIALDAVLIAGSGYLAQVIDGECRCRMGTHVKFLDAEVDAVGTSLNGRSERFARANRSHYFVILYHTTIIYYLRIIFSFCLRIIRIIQIIYSVKNKIRKIRKIRRPYILFQREQTVELLVDEVGNHLEVLGAVTELAVVAIDDNQRTAIGGNPVLVALLQSL